MRRFVLDCSVSAAWCLKEGVHDKALDILEYLTSGEALVPPLWLHEMANVLLKAELHGRISSQDVEREMDLLGELPITVVPETPKVWLEKSYRLAREYGLSAYDASYLCLAQRSRTPLASFDQALRKAAIASGVKLLEIY